MRMIPEGQTDGVGIDAPARPRRRTGAKLTQGQVLQVRDSLYAVLIDDMGFTLTDAVRVGRTMPLDPKHLLRRRRLVRGMVRTCGSGLRLLWTVLARSPYAGA